MESLVIQIILTLSRNVVMAHLQTLATRRDPTSRLQEKFRLAKMLYRRGYSRQVVIELFRFIDWVMVLPEELATGFSDMVFQYEAEMKMPYVTSVERQGIEKGKALGVEQGIALGRAEEKRKSVLRILEFRFGPSFPSSIVDRVGEIEDCSVLDVLFKEAMTVSSPHEFQRVLESKTST